MMPRPAPSVERRRARSLSQAYFLGAERGQAILFLRPSHLRAPHPPNRTLDRRGGCVQSPRTTWMAVESADNRGPAANDSYEDAAGAVGASPGFLGALPRGPDVTSPALRTCQSISRVPRSRAR